MFDSRKSGFGSSSQNSQLLRTLTEPVLRQAASPLGRLESQLEVSENRITRKVAHAAVEAMVVQPPTPSVDATVVAQATLDWASNEGLLGNAAAAEDAREIHAESLVVFCLAGEAPELVQLGADLVLWLYLFDDEIGEASAGLGEASHREKLATFSEVLRMRRRPTFDSKLHGSLWELRARAVKLGATPNWESRFADDMDEYFSGCADETFYRHTGQVPDIGTYRELRVRSIGTRPVFALIELGRGGVLSPGEAEKESVVELRRRAALLTAWVNDVYSYPKELQAGDSLNLVMSLTAECSKDKPETLQALCCAVEMYNRELRELEAACVDVCSGDCSAGLASYAKGLVQWVHGNRLWTQECGRYE